MLSIGVRTRLHVDFVISSIICLLKCRNSAFLIELTEQTYGTKIIYQFVCLFVCFCCICSIVTSSHSLLWSVLCVGQLDISKASQKAVGELDTVLAWLEGLEQRSLRWPTALSLSLPLGISLFYFCTWIESMSLFNMLKKKKMLPFLSTWCKHWNIYVFNKYIFVWYIRQQCTFRAFLLLLFFDLRHCIFFFLFFLNKEQN